MLRTTTTLLAALLIAVTPTVHAQSARPQFEVISIKPAVRVGPINTSPGGLFIASGQTIRRLINFAYKAGPFHVLGGPGWVDTDFWQIDAKPAEGSIPPGISRSEVEKRIELMAQSMLEDRFQLRVHNETRELPIYELVIAKGGLKMKLSDDQSEPAPGPPPRLGNGIPSLTRGMYRIGGGRIEGKAVTWDLYFNAVFKNSVLLDRPVIDKTNLSPQSRYDLKLEWTPNSSAATNAAAPDSTSIFTAIQEQLGLKLESARGPVEVLVVDSVSKPSEN